MRFTVKSKCTGCAALKFDIDNKGVESYICMLGHVLTYLNEDKQAYAPKPDEKCLKPLTEVDVDTARVWLKDYFKKAKRRRINARAANKYKKKRFNFRIK